MENKLINMIVKLLRFFYYQLQNIPFLSHIMPSTKKLNTLRHFYRKVKGFPILFYILHPQVFYKGVLSGPFVGTRFSYKTSWSFSPYLFLGTYEQELHWVWNYVFQKISEEKLIWVIGAAEGYYVCGIGKLNKNSIITAYESSEKSRKILKINIRLNNLDNRVNILGACEYFDLFSKLKSYSPFFIICDIEGYENHLFTNEILYMLTSTILLIEVHPPYNLMSKVDKLKETHAVFLINSKPRLLEDYTVLDIASKNQKCQWMNEQRPFSTPWLVAFPHSWQHTTPLLSEFKNLQEI